MKSQRRRARRPRPPPTARAAPDPDAGAPRPPGRTCRGRPRGRSRRSAAVAGRSCAARPAAPACCGCAGRPKDEASAADQPVDRRALLGGRGEVEAAQPGALLVAALAEDGVDEECGAARRGSRPAAGKRKTSARVGELVLAPPCAAPTPALRGRSTSAASSRPTAAPSTRAPGAKVAPQTCSRSAVERPSKIGSKPWIRSALVSIR